MTEDRTAKGLSGAGQALGIAGAATSAIPILGGVLSGLGSLFGIGGGIRAKKEAERQEEERQREAMKEKLATEFQSQLPTVDLGQRPTGGSKLGSVFGNMGSGVGTFGAKTNAASEFSVMGAMQNNMQLQKPTAQPLDIPQETPERPNMGTPQQAQPQQDLPQQQNATPKMGASNQQAQSPLGSELSNILTGLGSGGGGFYG